MDLGSLLSTVVSQSLGVRPKRHDAATRFILKGVRKNPGLALGAAVGAAGLAYGLWERTQRPSPAMPSAPPPPAPMPRGPVMPPPLPPMDEVAASASADASLRQARIVLAASQADGAVSASEMQRVLEAAREAGAESAVLADLATPREVESIVEGAADAAERQDLYALAFAIVRCDESVSDAERHWLERLAKALSLPPGEVSALESEVASAIRANG